MMKTSHDNFQQTWERLTALFKSAQNLSSQASLFIKVPNLSASQFLLEECAELSWCVSRVQQFRLAFAWEYCAERRTAVLHRCDQYFWVRDRDYDPQHQLVIMDAVSLRQRGLEMGTSEFAQFLNDLALIVMFDTSLKQQTPSQAEDALYQNLLEAFEDLST